MVGPVGSWPSSPPSDMYNKCKHFDYSMTPAHVYYICDENMICNIFKIVVVMNTNSVSIHVTKLPPSPYGSWRKVLEAH